MLKESTIRDNYINVICKIKTLFNGINASFLEEEEASTIQHPYVCFSVGVRVNLNLCPKDSFLLELKCSLIKMILYHDNLNSKFMIKNKEILITLP